MTLKQATVDASKPPRADRFVIAGTIALVVLGWVGLFHLVEREKTEAIEKAAATNASLTRAFGEHVRSGIKLIDSYSWQLATEIERLGIERVKLSAHWRQIDSALPFIQQITVIGADGKLAASAPAFARVDLADREHFRVHRDNDSAGLFIATPVRFRSSGKWTIPLSRRLYAPSGAFAGVLVIGLDAEYFSSYHSRLSLADRSGMAIARSDGVLLLRRIGDQIQHAGTATELPWFKAAQSERVGWSVMKRATDGARLVATYATMPDYPLVLALGTPLETALAPVYRRLPTYYAVAGAVTAALLLAALLVAQLFRRQTRANHDLAEGEARFRSLTALSSDWYWEQDEQFRIAVRSAGISERHPGASVRQIGSRPWDAPALNLSEADWAQHRTQLERHEPFHDFAIERAAGPQGTVWVSLSGEPVYGPGGEFRGYRGIGRDITERKRTERLFALEHTISRCLAANEPTETVMRTIIQTTCETQGWQCGRYFTYDEQAGVLRLADAWGVPDPAIQAFVAVSRDMEYRPGEGLAGLAWQTGEPVWNDDATTNKRSKYRAHPAMTSAGLRSAFVFPALAESEVIGVFAFNSTGIRARDDRLMQTARALGSLVGLFLQRRRADGEIRRLNAELEQRVTERTAELQSAVKEMETFTYTVAHDLRSPLRAMNGYCEILQQDYGSVVPDEGRDYLRRVAANAARLGNLIDDLLAFSRCSRSALHKGPVDMESLFRTVIAEQVPADDRTRLSVGALPACVGDPSLLRQVVTNLVSNAIKYSRNETAPTVEVDHADGAYFVRDNGVGFDMQYSDKLFGVFNRLHRSEEFEGTGVGLAIVKRIIDRHGGRVWAQAEPNRGATFYFTVA